MVLEVEGIRFNSAGERVNIKVGISNGSAPSQFFPA